MFPSPPEVTGVSYSSAMNEKASHDVFPSPHEVAEVSNVCEIWAYAESMAFPSPLEVTEVSYVLNWTERRKILWVSVPSRGDWGFLRPQTKLVLVGDEEFPSPLEVTGVSNPISCIGSSHQTTRSSLTSQLKLILIIPWRQQNLKIKRIISLPATQRQYRD